MGYGIWKKWDEVRNLKEMSVFSNRGVSHRYKWDKSGNLIYKKKYAYRGTRVVNKYWKKQYFFKNGSLKEEKIYDYGILKSSKTWNEEGELINYYELTTNCQEYKYWLKYNQQTTSTNPFSFSK